MTEWEEKTLGDITSIMVKGIPPKYVDGKSADTIYVLNQKCNRNFRISYEDVRLHDNSNKKAPAEKMLREGDVLINSTGTGTAGRVAQMWDVSTPTIFDGHMILLRPIDEIDILYYGYAIRMCQKKIESLAEGSTGQTEINRQRLRDEVIIKYPVALQDQHKIGCFLRDLDRKIMLNEQINKNLSLDKLMFVELLAA